MRSLVEAVAFKRLKPMCNGKDAYCITLSLVEEVNW